VKQTSVECALIKAPLRQLNVKFVSFESCPNVNEHKRNIWFSLEVAHKSTDIKNGICYSCNAFIANRIKYLIKYYGRKNVDIDESS
jgi:hypothetical protein